MEDKSVPSPVVMLSTREVARRTGFHESTIIRWAFRDGLKYIAFGPGNLIYIAENDIEQFLKIFYE
jgi:excisionase family DNA binding protein